MTLDTDPEKQVEPPQPQACDAADAEKNIQSDGVRDALASNNNDNDNHADATHETEAERWNHPRSNIIKTLATFWAFLVMGANDSAYGPIIPYVRLLLPIFHPNYHQSQPPNLIQNPQLETHYNLNYTTVSLVFLSPIGGYTLAALTNNTLHHRFGRRGIALLSPGCHLLAYIVNCLHPPYPVLVVSFIFAGLGNGLADSAWNAWIGDM
ncbi:hypothetical protein BJX70DRAFT_83127 [Aspergillus crustosus]